jgi:hypothetical protein
MARKALHKHVIERHFLKFLTSPDYFDDNGVCQLCGTVLEEQLERANHTAYAHDKLFNFVPKHLERFFK